VSAGVYVTVDVECSMGGAWDDASLRPVPPSRAMMGHYGQRQLGLPLIVDILVANGLVGTFFVDPFTEDQGFEGQTEPICRYLLDRGQDVQLHIHPNHWHFGLKQRGLPYERCDNMAELSAEEQLALIGEGAARLERWTGRRPVAFRAGNLAASELTLIQLVKAGIRIDSSYAFPFAGGQCRFSPENPFNGSRWYGQVLELALSGFRQPRLPMMAATKLVDPMGVCFGELRDAIERTCASGAEAVLVLHSFSLFKVRNVQYDGGRPNRIVTRRFRKLCGWLGRNADCFPARTFRQLAEQIKNGQYAAAEVRPWCIRRPARAALRKAAQAINRIYWV
jgi:hypothetical protein